MWTPSVEVRLVVDARGASRPEGFFLFSFRRQLVDAGMPRAGLCGRASAGGSSDPVRGHLKRVDLVAVVQRFFIARIEEWTAELLSR